MMRSLIVLIVFSYLITVSHSAIFMLGLGKCPKINNSLTDFDINLYMGIWYEQYRYFIVPDIGNVCTRINIKKAENGSTTYDVSFYNTWTEGYDTLSGTAKIEEAEGEGKYSLHFPGENLDDISVSYQIVDTDYDSYTVVASCNNKDGYYTRNMWVFTRDQLPSTETLKKALSALTKKKVSARFLHKVDHHSNCSDTEIDVNPDTGTDVDPGNETDVNPDAETDVNPDAEYLDDVDIETDAEEIGYKN